MYISIIDSKGILGNYLLNVYISEENTTCMYLSLEVKKDVLIY